MLVTSWLYRDNALVTATFRGQDVVTLFVAVPLLLVGLVLEMRGSQRGRILWLGMLFYMMYGYLFYRVAAAFNQFSLLDVADGASRASITPDVWGPQGIRAWPRRSLAEQPPRRSVLAGTLRRVDRRRVEILASRSPTVRARRPRGTLASARHVAQRAAE